MFENISIFIVNSSHTSIDNFTSILKTKIRSKQRPYVVCLSHDDFRSESDNNIESFLRNYINVSLTECRQTLEKSKQMNEFNQLEAWKAEATSTRLKNQLSVSKCERDGFSRIILDSPIDNGIELYVILFDIYDCDTIKLIASCQLVPLLCIVNFFPRYHKTNDDEHVIKCESFWQELLTFKFQSTEFDDIAFVDMDVPVESHYILSLRSQLICDQFCHFLYDFEELKCSYRQFCKRLIVHDVNIDDDETMNDLKQLGERLDEIPQCMMSVERIYEAIVDQIVNDTIVIDEEEPSSADLRKFIEIKAFGKRFYDRTDEWSKGCVENPKLYSKEIRKLEKISIEKFWVGIDTTVSLEQRQILNHFINKIANYIECNGKGRGKVENVIYFLFLCQMRRQNDFMCLKLCKEKVFDSTFCY